MDIYWLGQSCFKIKGKTATIVIDPFNPEFTGLKLPKDLDAQVALSTHSHEDHNNVAAVTGSPLVIAGPGEYEVAGVSVEGIATFHDNANGAEKGTNTAYHLLVDGINIVHLGDLGHKLTESQLSKIDSTDILMIPVGGKFSLDAELAVEVVAQLEPKIVIPMHYLIPELKIEGLEKVDAFLKEMGAENAEVQPKLSITRDKLPEATIVVVLSKS
ncbi:MAG: MBL fold metallo-hydrolase [Microgenomates group bacterium]|jgi:L-ascorbate metabolism protein UlaG (beta-lactamase superfamily)